MEAEEREEGDGDQRQGCSEKHPDHYDNSPTATKSDRSIMRNYNITRGSSHNLFESLHGGAFCQTLTFQTEVMKQLLQQLHFPAIFCQFTSSFFLSLWALERFAVTATLRNVFALTVPF